MSDAEPPPRSYEQPRRYEIPERFRPTPRRAAHAERTASGPAPERATAPTEPIERPGGPAPQPPAGGPGSPVAGPAGSLRPGGPGRRPAGGPPPRRGGAPPGAPGTQHRPGTKIVLPAVAAVVVVVAAALGAYFALSGGDGTSDTTAARQTVDRIYTALNAHDGAALQSLSCNRLARSLGTIDGTLNTVRDAAPTSGQTVTSGDARSTGTLIVTDTTNATARPMKVSFQLHLRKTGSRWCYSSLNATAHTPVGPAPPSAVGTSVTPGPSASTADPATVCHGLGHESQVLDLLVTAAVPAAADIMPISFVAPRSGTNVAYCRAFFRPEEAKRVAGVAVYSGVRMPQYVALLNSLSWRLITRSAVAPVYADQVGVHVTIVQSGPQLVLIASNPGR